MKATVHLQLTRQEAEQLVRILEGDLAELRFEIRDTDNADFRQGLKQQERFINDFLARLADKEPRVRA